MTQKQKTKMYECSYPEVLKCMNAVREVKYFYTVRFFQVWR